MQKEGQKRERKKDEREPRLADVTQLQLSSLSYVLALVVLCMSMCVYVRAGPKNLRRTVYSTLNSKKASSVLAQAKMLPNKIDILLLHEQREEECSIWLVSFIRSFFSLCCVSARENQQREGGETERTLVSYFSTSLSRYGKCVSKLQSTAVERERH